MYALNCKALEQEPDMKFAARTALVALALALTAGAAAAGEVRVTLTGVKAKPGQILATLQTEGQFMKGEGAYSALAPAPAADGSVTLVFPNVAPGAYAFSAMHDENGDYQMQREENGYPKEGWAMSKGAALRGPPTFAAVKIDVGATALTLTEPMIYPGVR
jgi:uncharacterized protein (DUF2141 family)